MKKAISILLVLVIVLSLCACGENNASESKFVGTYVADREGFFSYGYNEKLANTKEMTINNDGTGTILCKAKGSYPGVFWSGAIKDVSDGTVMFRSDFKWEVVDGYLSLTGTTTRYYTLTTSFYYLDEWVSEGITSTFTETYELKGNQLYAPNDDSASYNKIN